MTMKKTLSLILSVLVALTVASALPTLAAEAEGEEVRIVEINYNDSLNESIALDGSLEDWSDISEQSFTQSQLTSWVGSVRADAQMSTRFAADSQRLYVAFRINDGNVYSVPETDRSGGYGGYDAFQLSIDYGSVFAGLAQDGEQGVSRACFYSLARREDGMLALTTNEVAAADLTTVWGNGTDGVEGACKQTESGWQGELAIEWEWLHSHAVNKLLSIGADSVAQELEKSWLSEGEISVGVLACYIDYSEEGQFLSAYGVGKYADMSEGAQSGFRPENHGILVKISKENSKTPAEPELPEGDTQPTDAESESSGTSSTADVGGADQPKKSGCGALAGAGSVALVTLTLFCMGAVSDRRRR